MHWTGKVESIAFTIFGKPVAWYGIIITCAMLIGLLAAVKLAKRMNIKSDDLLEIFLIAIPLAVIGARAGFVIANASDFFVPNFGWSNFVDIIAVWDGGLTIMTGAPCGILGALIWCKWRKVNFLKLADTVICVMLLSQAIGRWGNFCNQEIFGLPVLNPSLQFFPYSVYIANLGGFYQATFFYEFIANLMGFGLMLYLSKHLLLNGSGLLLYGATYGFIRFIMEFFRETTDMFGIVNTNMIVCGIISGACIAALIGLALYKKLKKNEKLWYWSAWESKLLRKMGMDIPFENGIPAEFYADCGVKKREKIQN